MSTKTYRTKWYNYQTNDFLFDFKLTVPFDVHNQWTSSISVIPSWTEIEEYVSTILSQYISVGDFLSCTTILITNPTMSDGYSVLKHMYDGGYVSRVALWGPSGAGTSIFNHPYITGEGVKVVFENNFYFTIVCNGSSHFNMNYYRPNGTQLAGYEIRQDNGWFIPMAYTQLNDAIDYHWRGFWGQYLAVFDEPQFSGSTIYSSNSGVAEFYNGLTPIDPDNPYYDGGISTEGGGDGNFSEDSDDVEEDSLPSITAVGTGMATIFSPSKSQLKSLSEVFWGSQWWTALQNTIEGIDKMFVSLGIVPFSVTKGSTVEVTWLGLSITEVTLTLASQQFYEFDMGTIDLSNDSRIFTSGSALDYSPFSRLGIYLPFIGFQDLDIDECRGTTINLKYRIDILSGTCVALIKISGKTIYQFTGNCITQIPITSQNFENIFTNAVNVGIALGTARNAAAVASAGEAVSSEMVQQGKMSATAAALDATQRSARVSAANASLGNATANAMMGMKPDFNKTGSVSASASLLTVKQPFLYLKTPRQCLPDHYQRYCGFPSNMTGKLREFSGYTVVEDIRLNGLVATNGEVEEIYDLLKSGVIV